MAGVEENSALFPIFILSMMALPLVPYTIVTLCRSFSRKQRVFTASVLYVPFWKLSKMHFSTGKSHTLTATPHFLYAVF